MLADHPYRDPERAVPDRVADLLARLTIEEKVGQMMLASATLITGPPGEDRGPIDDEQLRRVVGGQLVGGLLSGGGHAPATNAPADWAEMIAAFQRATIDHTRWGIPLLYGVDAVHGHNNVVGATIFPHNIGLAASFDPDLVERAAVATARAVRATGANWAYAPVADLGRDPRWGRFYETFGEAHVVVGELAAANVRGLQGGSLASTDTAAASLKHFLGYGAGTNGFDRTDAQLPRRTLRDRYLPPFAAAVEARPATVMVNSGSVNGVPAHGSRTLLTDVLRGELGFEGVVVTDWGDIEMLATDYEIADDLEAAVERAVNAGVDMAMLPSDGEAFRGALLSLVTAGRVGEGRIDEAVARILTLKFELGLFERPSADPDRADAAVIVQDDRSLARDAAAASAVLLRNDGVLPIDPAARVLVTGPGADQLSWQMGGWTIRWQGDPRPGEQPPAVTIADAFRAEFPEDRLVVLPGAPVEPSTDTARLDELRAAAVAAASEVDVVIAVVGEPPGAELPADHPTADLREDQRRLVAELAATGAPVVTVMLAGRPLLLGEVDAASRALLMAHLPGTEAGTALADLLLGRRSFGGRLPYSWPRHLGQLPLHHDVLPGAQGDSAFATGTRGGQYDPLFPLGHGLSTTSFEVADVELEASELPPDGTARVAMTVANTGERPGVHIVPVFALQTVSSVVRPYRLLVGWARAELAPGEQQRAEARIPLERLAITQGDVFGEGERIVEPGHYTLCVGDAATVSFTVVP